MIGIPRSFNLASSIMPVHVFDGERNIGSMKGRQFLTWERDPGRATIKSRANNDSTVEVNVEAGKTYYVLQRIGPANWTPESPMVTKLQLVDADNGAKELKKAKPGKAKGAGDDLRVEQGSASPIR